MRVYGKINGEFHFWAFYSFLQNLGVQNKYKTTYTVYSVHHCGHCTIGLQEGIGRQNGYKSVLWCFQIDSGVWTQHGSIIGKRGLLILFRGTALKIPSIVISPSATRWQQLHFASAAGSYNASLLPLIFSNGECIFITYFFVHVIKKGCKPILKDSKISSLLQAKCHFRKTISHPEQT